jgi:hypothetical protein
MYGASPLEPNTGLESPPIQPLGPPHATYRLAVRSVPVNQVFWNPTTLTGQLRESIVLRALSGFGSGEVFCLAEPLCLHLFLGGPGSGGLSPREGGQPSGGLQCCSLPCGRCGGLSAPAACERGGKVLMRSVPEQACGAHVHTPDWRNAPSFCLLPARGAKRT